MQSFRERGAGGGGGGGGYHANPACYQPDPQELSRLESYRQHPHHPHPQHPHAQHPHAQHQHPGGPGPGLGPQQQQQQQPQQTQHSRPGYEAHPLSTAAAGMPASGAPGLGAAQKDCYSQHSYTGYPGGSGGGAGSGSGGPVLPQAKKAYRGGKTVAPPPPPPPSQHLQAPSGYGGHMGPGGYPAQYMAEGHLQAKWEDQAQLAQYEQELAVARMEPGAPGPAPGGSSSSSQYMEQSMLGHSQGQCQQPSNPIYTSPHHQTHPANPAPSPLLYPQSHLHYPQHAPSPSPYMEKCGPMAHCYKGYGMPSGAQYSRPMAGHPGLKQTGYRPGQSSYSYQQPPSRGYESQPPLQAMSGAQESHSKYYGAPQQNYCLSELSVRSPEQYYQTCSPSSSHSPARSVGRSPSYSSTPSPLMTNPESFQYGQPPMTPGAASSTSSSSSSSSAALQDQGTAAAAAAATAAMLMPPRSHPTPSVAHAPPQSYTAAPQGPSMKERFSEKLLSNPSLWSLNALTSQVENISNNVQQMLLSEALVANKKGGKRPSGGSNSSGGSSKKGEEYKSPPYPDGGGGVGGGPLQDATYATPHHRPTELHEGGYSSSSDEQLERGCFYYCSQGRSPAQPATNTQLSHDTGSSCSMTSPPDDMSTRSGDSGLHNLTPDPRYQSGQGSDGIRTPVKSVGDERSPTCMSIHSPLKQERDSPPDIQRMSEHVKENFEESAWTEKLAEEEEVTLHRTPDLKERSADSPEKMDKWSEDEKGPSLYTKINEGMTEKGFYYDETVYQGIPRKYDPDGRDFVEQSPAALSDCSHKGHLEREIKSDAFKSESPTASESSMKTSPFISRGDLERDQYYMEKDDSSESNSLSPKFEALDGVNAEKKRSRDDDVADDEAEEQDGQPEMQQHAVSPPLSVDVSDDVDEGRTMSQPSTEGNIHYQEGPEGTSPADSCGRLNVPEPHTDAEPVETAPDRDAASTAVTATDASERETAIGDTVPQPQSAMPVFSVLNDQAQSRERIDHSDAKVLEPDSPQLPGRSILPPAPCWADTPPSPKKGDEDMEPGLSCPSAATPSAKEEPLAPSDLPRVFVRKHARGRRRVLPNLERGDEKEDGVTHSPEQKPFLAPSKTVLFSDQMDLAHQETILSQAPKSLAEGFRSRMCTRSYNAPDIAAKIEPNAKRKPGPKPCSKPGPKPVPKQGAKPGAKSGVKAGKPAAKPKTKPGQKTGPKPAFKPEITPPDPLAPEVESPIKRKPGPKPGSKAGSKPVLKLCTKPAPKPGLPAAEASASHDAVQSKAAVGRPKGSVSKAKLTQKEEVTLASVTLSSNCKHNIKATVLTANLDTNESRQEHDEAKAPEKNMVLRSRKPAVEKPLKEKITVLEEDIVGRGLAETQSSDSLNIGELNSIEQNQTESDILIVDEDNTDVSVPPAAQPIPPHPDAVSDEGMLPCLKRKAGPEATATPVKKKRGPKPKPKPPAFETTILDLATHEPKLKVVRAPKRKRGPPKKAQGPDPSKTKDPAPPVADSEATGEVPPAVPQCRTKRKVLPPRKGRGQKYEAMVQKISSPSSKKHLLIAHMESAVTEDALSKASSQHGLRDSEALAMDGTETSPVDINRTVEEPLKPSKVSDKNIVQEEVGVDNEAVTQREERREMKRNGSSSGGAAEDGRNVSLAPEEVRPDNTGPEEMCREEQIESQGTLLKEVGDRLWGLTDTGAQSEWMPEPSAGLPELAAKPARTKRKRWALVESTDASVMNMEVGSLIVTTQRLAKQRAIKNNHEMHLKQKRKSRKGQPSAEDGEEVQEEMSTGAAGPLAPPPAPPPAENESETTATPTRPAESCVPAPMGPDMTDKPGEVTATEPAQKPKRGRKPAAKKPGKVLPPEQIPGKPGKAHKKPGPKPGMKDAMEVIEAVVRAAECEQTEKEEREKQEREQRELEQRREAEEVGTPHQRTAGPGVFTGSKKRTEVISMKRIRRKPVAKETGPCFHPHVRINNSRDFASWCAVINSAEEAAPIQRFKKKRLAKMKNPITAAKVVPHTAAMLQGPLVSGTLPDRCPTCCLCGKPSNYRDLGDLCGPYYIEDRMPRKILSSRHLGGFRGVKTEDNSNNSNSDNNNNNSSSSSSISEEAPGSSTGDPDCSPEKEGSPEAPPQGGACGSGSGQHHGRHRRPEGPAERSGREGGPRRLTLRERFRRIKMLQDMERGEGLSAPGEQGEDSGGGPCGAPGSFQRLRDEAEANEHWAHENCTVWTRGVIMVAGRLYGLTEAARTSTQTACFKCQTVGASLGCCWAGCSRRYHYVCAREIGCTFHEVDLSITCPTHQDV